jgi:hypothetical protein
MSIHICATVPFGELVAATFDEAARYSTDPREVSRLATRAVRHMLWRKRKTSQSARRLRRLLRHDA